MTDYEGMARAAEMSGKAEAARIRARALLEEADRLSGKTAEREKYQREHNAFVAREVAAGRMCPGGCDTAVGGCFKHADRC